MMGFFFSIFTDNISNGLHKAGNDVYCECYFKMYIYSYLQYTGGFFNSRSINSDYFNQGRKQDGGGV